MLRRRRTPARAQRGARAHERQRTSQGGRATGRPQGARAADARCARRPSGTARILARRARRAPRAGVGARPHLRLERLGNSTGRAARSRRQRRSARLSSLRALVREHLRGRPVPARAAPRGARTGACGVGRGLSSVQRPPIPAPESNGAAANGDLVEFRGDQAHGRGAAVHRAGAGARRALGARPWRPLRRGRA